jgi:UDPglucose--hexose-1-phosphate uridylyltransferase
MLARRDYFTEKLVLIKSGAWKLKHDKKPKPANAKDCLFCPGKESKTPPSDLVLASRHGTMLKLSDTPEDYVQDWVVRVIPNQFPAVTPDSPKKYSDAPLYSEPAVGYHYIVVASQKHVNLEDIDADQWVNILSILQDKARWLYARKNVAYVAIFMNQGKNAGASRSHAHLQIMTLPVLPPTIETEAKAVQKAMQTSGACPMCGIITTESEGPRKIVQTDTFLAFAPYASSHPFELWIFPKAHQVSFLRTSQKEIMDLARLLELCFAALSTVTLDLQFNAIIHTSPEKRTSKQIHWHIEVYPRLDGFDGFERGTGVYVNPIAPEEAAKVLRDACSKLLKK